MTDGIHGFGPLGYAPPGAMRVAGVDNKVPEQSAAQLERTCQDFEALFIQHMMQQMRRTVPEGDLFGGGRAEEMYTAMLDSEMAQSIARHRGMGLAAVLFRQLKDRM
ncbi:rod-binding protein [Desulfatitalea alkaliphila]|uniref:Rod-binding protein n=1 Tax=Desulfatitalea alkaliphila TaxID=2929485 RepID=A0AA41UKB8_9BACT|nr:rod-binding protein [Desulfatitalea alkaliphila]MCJ8501282.1 rod-binding protein [Desulfatitalea alkaliphila]